MTRRWLSTEIGEQHWRMDDVRLIARLEQVSAENAVAFALALSAVDRSWGTETLAVAGGQLVLAGRGCTSIARSPSVSARRCAPPTSG